MEIEIRTYGDVREMFDGKEFTHVIPPGSTVEDVLVDFENTFDLPDEPDLLVRFHQETVLVVRNGTNVKLLDGAETSLEDGDRLSLTSSPMPEG